MMFPHTSLGTGYESGGPGTMYKEVTNPTASHSEIFIDNGGIPYPHEPVYSMGALRNVSDGDYTDITEIGGVAWLYHSSHHYQFDVATVSGNAHVAILSDTSQEDVDVRIGYLYGDKTGVLHAGQRQTFGYAQVNSYLPVNVMAYR